MDGKLTLLGVNTRRVRHVPSEDGDPNPSHREGSPGDHKLPTSFPRHPRCARDGPFPTRSEVKGDLFVRLPFWRDDLFKHVGRSPLKVNKNGDGPFRSKGEQPPPRPRPTSCPFFPEPHDEPRTTLDTGTGPLTPQDGRKKECVGT